MAHDASRIGILGAVAGDVIGSAYERNPVKREDFPLFAPQSTYTDDSVLTVATASVLLDGGDFAHAYRDFGRRYPGRGYGGGFRAWLERDDAGPYNSLGNGSAMRVSPVGFFAHTLDEAVTLAARSAEVTHNHPEGIAGACVTAAAIFLAKAGASKEEIRARLQERFGYDLSGSVEALRPGYAFDVTCAGTVPAALLAFFDSASYEDALRKAISLGGDADTLACITGGVAAAYYRAMPDELARRVSALLSEEMREIVARFDGLYGVEAA